MSTTLCHFSDWHGEWSNLPKADIYVCTGDMLLNYPTIRGDFVSTRERSCQEDEMERVGARQYLGNPDAPVISVRGNHDFSLINYLFHGGPSFEIVYTEDQYSIEGLLFGGMRGINWIEGTWADELNEEEQNEEKNKLSNNIEILLTHAPPKGILDKAPRMFGFGVENCGLGALANYHIKREYDENLKPTKLHCFGHIHECFGVVDHGTLYSNAATGYNLFEITEGKEVSFISGEKLF